MKRCICFFIIIALSLGLIGCAKPKETIQEPTRGYYCTDPNDYKNTRKVIEFEVFDAEAYNDDLQLLLNDYLKGPKSDKLTNPFPDSCAVESINIHGDEVHLVLNTRFARLTGVDLMLACACISLTLFALSDCNSVYFSVPNILLDGQREIIMQRDDIILEYINK